MKRFFLELGGFVGALLIWPLGMLAGLLVCALYIGLWVGLFALLWTLSEWGLGEELGVLVGLFLLACLVGWLAQLVHAANRRWRRRGR